MKRQKNIRLSERTWEKIEWLSTRYGTQTTAIEIAIDQLYEKEKKMSEKPITFYVIRDADAYGENATDETHREYAKFAENWLKQHGYINVDIEFYDGFLPSHLSDEERDEQEILNSKIWDAWTGE